MKLALYWACGLSALALASSVPAEAQELTGTRTPLAALILEAESSNAAIAAAEDGWKAATHVAEQVKRLPDPQFSVQSFSVGSPKPFAGFSNSDFAYIGLGASQELPYAGKLRLKGEVAERDAAMEKTKAELVRWSITDEVKGLYLRLGYLEKTLSILGRDEAVLKPMIETALARYSVGEGSETEVLKAQIEHTKILREITEDEEERGQVEAGLKALLHRSQSTADIVPEPLTPTRLGRTAAELEGLVCGHNPAVSVESADVHKQDARLRSAEREGKPDFNVGYTFEQTGGGYRDYYMLTVSMRLPRRKRVEAGVAEAAESLERSKQELDSEVQQQLAEVQKQYVTVMSTEQLMKEYEEGLLPEARAEFEAERAQYQSGQAGQAGGSGLAPVLASLLDVLKYEREYQQALLDHESAMARLETLTGARLR